MIRTLETLTAFFAAKFPGRAALLVAACCLLGACGGRGASPGPVPVQPVPPAPPPVTPPPVTPDDFRTAEYNRNWGLEAIQAADAYARGYAGDGVMIGIVDYNFDFATPELDLHPSSRGADPSLVAIYEAQIGDTVSRDAHGHAVAVTAAGRKNDQDTHGVAFDATVVAVDFFSGVNSFRVAEDGIDYTVSDPWSYLVASGARVVNKSFGYDEGDVISNPPQVSERYFLDFDTNVIAAGGLLVTAAGNNGDPEPSLSALRALDRAVRENLFTSGGGYIIAGSVNEQLQLSPFSDAAGRAMDYYLVAPGEDVAVPFGGALVSGSGTSFAAPHVTGAAAILFQKWPGLTAGEVADILFETATDLGERGIDEVYGHGLLNLAEALRPIGAVALVRKNGMTVPMVPASIVVGPAFGDVIHLREALAFTYGLDRYGRDFQVNAAGLIQSASPAAPLANRMASSRNWQQASVSLDKSAVFRLGFNGRDAWLPPEDWLTEHNDFIQRDRQITFDLNGRAFGLDWRLGRGRGLSAALSGQSGPFGQDAGGFAGWLVASRQTPDALMSGQYATVTSALSSRMSVTVGVSRGVHSSGTHPSGIHPSGPAFLADAVSRPEATVFATRLDHFHDGRGLSLEVGLMQETGSFLGSRTSGVFDTDRESGTAWLRAAGTWRLAGGWHLFTEFTGSKSNQAPAGNSIFLAAGPVISSAFSLAVNRQNLWRQGDRFNVAIRQPYRVEKATVTLELATGRTGQGQTPGFETAGFDTLGFDTIDISLVPSGRELVFETAYARPMGNWLLETNLAYRHQADHVAGRREALFLLGLSKLF